MNSRVEPVFRDAKEARQKLVRLTSGMGFRLLVEQALAPGEPLQINTGDRQLLVLVRYSLPVENSCSIGGERSDDWRPADIPSKETAAGPAPPQIEEHLDQPATSVRLNLFSRQRSSGGPLGLIFGGIAALIGVGILLGGIRVDGGPNVLRRMSASMARKAEKPRIATLPVESKPANSVQPPAVAVSEPKVPSPLVSPVSSSTGGTLPSATPTPASSPSQAAILPQSTSPVTVPHSGPFEVTIHASALSWVNACADGNRIFAKALSAGETSRVTFSKVATIRTGNAGALDIAFGSKTAERTGQKGSIQMWRFTPEGPEEVPSTSETACPVHQTAKVTIVQ